MGVPSEYVNPYINASFLEWLVQFRSVKDIWEVHPTNLAHEFHNFAGGLITLIHALCVGGYYPFLWLLVTLHGCIVEVFAYVMPDVDNFWHAHSSVMLIGGRLPLHIVFLYPTLIYSATVAVLHLRLPRLSEAFIVGLCVVLIDIPYDIIGIKHLWWTWHDTDPNIYDRFYWVPWTSFYFHTTFATSLTFFYNVIRKKVVGRDKFDPNHGSIFKELLACVLASPLGLIGGIVLFIPLYHPLHDFLKVYTGVIYVVGMLLIVLMAWNFDRIPPIDARPIKQRSKVTSYNGLLMAYLIFHYTLFVMLTILSSPENYSATGFHEPVGDCNKFTPVQTPIGLVLKKRSYLCLDDYDEDYDWHCHIPPAKGESWYTLCGTPYKNFAEYVVIICTVGFTALFIYYQLLYRSAVSIFKTSKIKQK